LLGGLRGPAGLTAAAVGGVGVLLARLRPAWFTGVRYGLLLIAAVALLTLAGTAFTGGRE
ncbi:MAG TPA: hypothetical protein VJ773_11880, partial [Gemmatimonadales bacterium]|nr:hypothetical protein [Gemmatimonadales bacterium]